MFSCLIKKYFAKIKGYNPILLMPYQLPYKLQTHTFAHMHTCIQYCLHTHGHRYNSTSTSRHIVLLILVLMAARLSYLCPGARETATVFQCRPGSGGIVGTSYNNNNNNNNNNNSEHL